MFRIRSAQAEDVGPGAAALAQAFAGDPLMLYVFRDHPHGVPAAVNAFFDLLLRARIALGSPALVLQQGDKVLGAVMGNTPSPPPWPPALSAEWDRMETDIPGFAHRFAAYEAICGVHEPAESHHYLGVIGVHPSFQGQGAGKALLEAFCALSSADDGSQGVYLDTTNPKSLQFYYDNGFELRGEGSLEGAPVWCVYRRT